MKNSKNIFGKFLSFMRASSFALLAFALSSTAFSDEGKNPYDALSSYKDGDSLAWYYEIEEFARNPESASEIEDKILEKLISKKNISEEAFNKACAILKLVASDKSAKELFPFLNDPQKVVSACEVIKNLNSPAAEVAMREALKRSKTSECAVVLISSLGAFGKDRKSLEAILKASEYENEEIGEAAIYALGSFKGNLSKLAFEKLSNMQLPLTKKYVQAWKWAMLRQAQNLINSGHAAEAKIGLEKMPDTQIGKTTLLAKTIELPDARVEFLISRFLSNGKDLPEVGRALNTGMTFENSKLLVEKFSSFSKNQKLIAIALFANAGDKRFFEAIAPELDSSDADIRAEVLFAARFLAGKKQDFEKILKIAKSEDGAISKIAEKVLEENPSSDLSEVLRADSGDLFSLRILARRGDDNAFASLQKMFLENSGDGKISSAFESVLTLKELPDFVKNYKLSDAKTKTAITRTTIKVLAKLRNRQAIEAAAEIAIGDSILPDDKNFALIENRLKIEIPQGKKVWQEQYFKRAVSDSKMIVATSPEPNLNEGFVPMFDGKTLNGWRTTTGSAKYEVVDGQIIGTLDPKMRKNSFLVTERNDYTDFIFTCEFKWLEHSNSGIIYRGSIDSDGFVIGPQAEIDDAPRAWSGGIYSEKASWIYSISREDQEHVRRAIKLDDWNRLTIYCKGAEMKTWLNGVPAAQVNWPEFKSGFIGLQIHFGKKGKVAWRNLKIKEGS